MARVRNEKWAVDKWRISIFHLERNLTIDEMSSGSRQWMVWRCDDVRHGKRLRRMSRCISDVERKTNEFCAVSRHVAGPRPDRTLVLAVCLVCVRVDVAAPASILAKTTRSRATSRAGPFRPLCFLRLATHNDGNAFVKKPRCVDAPCIHTQSCSTTRHSFIKQKRWSKAAFEGKVTSHKVIGFEYLFRQDRGACRSLWFKELQFHPSSHRFHTLPDLWPHSN